jgi:cell division protein FtsI (penicillin-binding protein 3)
LDGVPGALLVWAWADRSKLFWLQIMRHKEFVEKAQKQQQHTFEVAPRRGVLYDRNLRELAMTVLADSIYAVPSEIDDKTSVVHAAGADRPCRSQKMLDQRGADRPACRCLARLCVDCAPLSIRRPLPR